MVTVACYADSEEDLRRYQSVHDAEVKRAAADIPKVVEKYASAMGCNFNIDPKNVIPYSVIPDLAKSYVAVYGLDLGCSGGNSMDRSFFVYVQLGSGYKFYVNPTYSNPEQTSDKFPAWITKLYLKNGEIWFDAKDWAGKDANCCPSLTVSGRVYFENGNWKRRD